MSKVYNIAIDGPAGAGKSTIAKAAAKQLGFIYVDTGALYRAVAFEMMSRGISAGDKEKVAAELEKFDTGFFSLRFIDGVQHVFSGEKDVSGMIRTPEVSMGASAVSAIPEVRKFLFELQRSIAAENNVIMDGRDIGTVVLPNADLKIFLTASAEVRADRRYKELAEKPDCPTYEQVLADIKQRDYNDMNRETAPLKQADDAVLADTSNLDLDGAISLIISLIKEKCSL
ncbi:MAG: (d)CMP kinase [Oscillospiraceae bacterium]